jgi:hypothetical protein
VADVVGVAEEVAVGVDDAVAVAVGVDDAVAVGFGVGVEKGVGVWVGVAVAVVETVALAVGTLLAGATDSSLTSGRGVSREVEQATNNHRLLRDNSSKMSHVNRDVLASMSRLLMDYAKVSGPGNLGERCFVPDWLLFQPDRGRLRAQSGFHAAHCSTPWHPSQHQPNLVVRAKKQLLPCSVCDIVPLWHLP